MNSTPLTDVQAVVTAQQLADWVGVDSSDPLLGSMILAATSAAIEYLKAELINRERRAVYQFWPITGTPTGRAISRPNAYVSGIIELPYASPLASITEVKVAGEVTTDYAIRETLTASLSFDTISTGDDVPAVEVTYTSGHGNIDNVPTQIKTAVLMAADFMFNNRGSCSAADVLEKSGAASLLFPFRAKAVVL